MAGFPDADAVYTTADLFRNRCLVEGRSFLWPDHQIWTEENLRLLWKMASSKTDIPHLAEALSNEPVALRMIACDVMVAGTIFPAVKRSTQERNIRELLDALDVPTMDSETWNRLVSIWEAGVPASVTHYPGQKFQNFLTWLLGLRVMVEKHLVNSDRDTIIREIESASGEHEAFWATLFWGLLHVMYPEQFPAVPGKTDRKKILDAFASRLPQQEFANDFAALDHLRQVLAEHPENQPFDFYYPSIFRQWEKDQKRVDRLTGYLGFSPIVHSPRLPGATEQVKNVTEPIIDDMISFTHLPVNYVQEIDNLLSTKRQLIFEGPPGSGKTFVAEKFARWFTGQPLDDKIPLNNHVEIVQFHQSYGYEDFVQGIRPRTNEHGQLVYVVEPGIFLQMCQRAAEDSENPYVLIIDEINRGNLSRIFGELLLLLEYRGMKVRLPYDSSYLEIPKNLYIIGTMNTADRSLAQIDYALRRRFYFVRFMPVENGRAEVYENWLARNVDHAADRERLRDLFIALNHGIRNHLNTDDLQVGHSYFMQPGIETDLVFERVWRRAVRPLLEEYLHHHRERDEILAALTPQRLAPVPAQDGDDLTDATGPEVV